MAQAPDPRDIGAHFLLGLQPTPVLTTHDRHILETLRPAGVVVFRDNFDQAAPYADWHARFAALLEDVRGCLGRAHFIVAIDHEGGRVIRPPAPITHFDYAAAWADNSAEIGRAMGFELASLGVNLNFAPVLDIHSNPANPVIGPRAFCSAPDAVSRAALDFASAMQGAGVLACGKHFPGHGDTSEDSHFALPRADVDMATLQARELAPFEGAIAAKMPMLMTSHMMVPALDPAAPVTLSRTAVQGQLRATMGYGGVVVTDDIGMHAMDGFLDSADAAVQVFAAGHDLMMLCAHWTDTGRILGFAEALRAAAGKDSFARDVLAPSRRRIDALLKALPQNAPHLLPPKVFAQHAALAPLYGGTRATVV